MEAIFLYSCLTHFEVKTGLSAFRKEVTRERGVLTSCRGPHITASRAAVRPRRVADTPGLNHLVATRDFARSIPGDGRPIFDGREIETPRCVKRS